MRTNYGYSISGPDSWLVTMSREFDLHLLTNNFILFMRIIFSMSMHTKDGHLKFFETY